MVFFPGREGSPALGSCHGLAVPLGFMYWDSSPRGHIVERWGLMRVIASWRQSPWGWPNVLSQGCACNVERRWLNKLVGPLLVGTLPLALLPCYDVAQSLLSWTIPASLGLPTSNIMSGINFFSLCHGRRKVTAVEGLHSLTFKRKGKWKQNFWVIYTDFSIGTYAMNSAMPQIQMISHSQKALPGWKVEQLHLRHEFGSPFWVLHLALKPRSVFSALRG